MAAIATQKLSRENVPEVVDPRPARGRAAGDPAALGEPGEGELDIGVQQADPRGRRRTVPGSGAGAELVSLRKPQCTGATRQSGRCGGGRGRGAGGGGGGGGGGAAAGGGVGGGGGGGGGGGPAPGPPPPPPAAPP